jgi:hypothetical protein
MSYRHAGRYRGSRRAAAAKAIEQFGTLDVAVVNGQHPASNVGRGVHAQIPT